MQYMMLIYVNEELEANRSKEAFDKIFKEYEAFDKVVKEKNAAISAAALQPTSTATTVKIREGKVVTMDGPYAEAKEQLGGYYLLECDNLDEAIELASMIPDAKHGVIEIRPKMMWS